MRSHVSILQKKIEQCITYKRAQKYIIEGTFSNGVSYALLFVSPRKGEYISDELLAVYLFGIINNVWNSTLTKKK